MENKILSFNPKDGIDAQKHRKEEHFFQEYVIIQAPIPNKNERFRAPVVLRIYGTSRKTYACFWVFGEKCASGSGDAGGYGYDRISAAAGHAIEAAGFKLKNDIDGRGESAIDGALNAIADYLGLELFYIHKAHA